MIQVNLAQVLKQFDDDPFYEKIIKRETDLIVSKHIDVDKK